MMNKRAVLNVGGERHEVLWRTLEQIPYSRLGGKTSCIFKKFPIPTKTSRILIKLSSIAGKLAVASSHESVMEQADYYSLIGETPLLPSLLSNFLCYPISFVIQFPLVSNFLYYPILMARQRVLLWSTSTFLQDNPQLLQNGSPPYHRWNVRSYSHKKKIIWAGFLAFFYWPAEQVRHCFFWRPHLLGDTGPLAGELLSEQIHEQVDRIYSDWFLGLRDLSKDVKI